MHKSPEELAADARRELERLLALNRPLTVKERLAIPPQVMPTQIRSSGAKHPEVALGYTLSRRVWKLCAVYNVKMRLVSPVARCELTSRALSKLSPTEISKPRLILSSKTACFRRCAGESAHRKHSVKRHVPSGVRLRIPKSLSPLDAWSGL